MSSRTSQPNLSSKSRRAAILAAANATGMLNFTADSVQGRTFTHDGETLLNFSSCSYLGLETHPDLTAGAITAIAQYGVQLSSSRTYLQSALYNEAEDLFTQIAGQPTLVFPSTTLAHFGIMPAVITPKDAVLTDRLVHASVRSNLLLTQAAGTTVRTVDHSNMNAIDDAVRDLRASGITGRIWIAVDGVYSMRGDTAPATDLVTYAETHDDVWLYVDDAHGFSWTGQNGRGWWLENAPANNRTLLTGSLSKSFAAGGGLGVFPDQDTADLVRVMAGSLVFAGPLPPPVLGALVASAHLHLSPELPLLQTDLQNKIDTMATLLIEHGITDWTGGATPIFFVTVGSVERGTRILMGLKDAGYMTNLAMFPVVPVDATGIRFTLSNHLTHDDLTTFAATLADLLHRIP